MLLQIKPFLRENPCYIVALFFLALDGELDLLYKIYGGEKGAFDALRSARTYESFMRSYPPQDFPIYLSRKNEITKMPSRFVGILLAEKPFWGVQSDAKPVESYGKDWLLNFTPKEQKRILKKYNEILEESPHSVAPHLTLRKDGLT